MVEKPRSRGSRYPAFVDLVRRQLGQVYREDDLRSEGLRIFTTLSPSEQEKAQKAAFEKQREQAKPLKMHDPYNELGEPISVAADEAEGEGR